MAILTIGVSTWILCSIFFGLLAIRVKKDMEKLRLIMWDRAKIGKMKAKETSDKIDE